MPHDLHGDQFEHPPTLIQHDILYPLKYTQKILHQVQFNILNCINNYIIIFK